MNLYRPLDWFMVRSPFLSIEEGAALLRDPDLIERVLEDEQISEIIGTAAPSLFAALKTPPQDEDRRRALRRAAFDVVSRMTYRTAPYSCFAGVGLGRIESGSPGDPEHYVLFEEKRRYRRSFAPLPSRPGSEAVVAANPTLFFKNGIAHYVVSDETASVPPRRSYRYTSMSIPKRLMRLLLESPNSLPSRYKRVLTDGQVLWRVASPRRRRPHAVELETLAASISSSKRRSADSELIEMHKPCARARLPDSVASALGNAAETLISLFGHTAALSEGARRMQAAKDAFLERHELQEVPLLELLGPDSAVGDAFKAEGAPPAALKDFEDHLTDLVLDPDSRKAGVLRLAAHQVDRLRQFATAARLPAAAPDSFVALGEIVRLDDGSPPRLQIKNLSGPHGMRHFSRYLGLDAGLNDAARSLARGEEGLHAGTLFAEILHAAEHPGVDRVAPETAAYAACVPLSRTSFREPRERVALSDLRVFVDQGIFQLRSESLNRRVIPILTNLHNFEIDGHPVYQFLAGVESQGGFSDLRWSWGSLQRFAHLPRVEYGGVVLSPARWKLSNSRIRRLLRDGLNSASIEAALTEIGVPSVFELHDRSIGTKAHFDLSIPGAHESLLHNLHENRLIDLQESFVPCGVRGPEGRYRHDLLVPFIRSGTVQAPNPGYHLEKGRLRAPKPAEIVFTPGSSWSSYDVYMPASQADAFAAVHLASLRARLGQDWFFLRYRDADFHIRLRVRGRGSRAVEALLSRLVRNGFCSRFSVKTYRREIERYGGLEGCRIFEELSRHDSDAAVEAAKIFLRSKLPRVELWTYAAILSAESYLSSFGADRAAAIALLTPAPRLRAAATDPAARPSALEVYKRSRLGGMDELPLEYRSLARLYRTRRERQTASFRRLRRLTETGRLLASEKRYFAALVHLSFVRLDLDLDQHLEELVLDAVRHARAHLPAETARPGAGQSRPSRAKVV